MITELYGLPGSGKTTLAKKMAKEQGYTIIKIRRKRELFYYNFLFLTRHPYKFFALLFFLLKYGYNRKLLYYKLMNTFFDYNAKYQKARKYEKAVLDQGYFTNVYALFDKAVSAELMKKYLNLILKPDKLIILDIPFALSRQRGEERGYYAREEFDSEYREKWQRALRANNRTFLGLVSGIGVQLIIKN